MLRCFLQYLKPEQNVSLQAILKYDENADTEDFINNLYEHLFIPLISRPTRFNINSSTLIDDIFSNKPYDSLVSGILNTDVSDHFPVGLFYISKHKNPQNKNSAYDLFLSKFLEIYNRNYLSYIKKFTIIQKTTNLG